MKETPQIYTLLEGYSQTLKLLEQYLNVTKKIKTSNLAVTVGILALKKNFQKNGNKLKSVDLHAHGGIKHILEFRKIFMKLVLVLE